LVHNPLSSSNDQQINTLVNNLSSFFDSFYPEPIQKLKQKFRVLQDEFQYYPVPISSEINIDHNIITIQARGWSSVCFELEFHHERTPNCFKVLSLFKRSNCGTCSLVFFKVSKDWVQQMSNQNEPTEIFDKKFYSVDDVISELDKEAD
jgi:hypothetical protein